MLINDILVALGLLTDKGAGADANGNLLSGAAAGDVSSPAGNVKVLALGKGLQVKTGANARIGRAGPMVAGSIVVANTSVTANTRAFCQHEGDGAGAGVLKCDPANNVPGVSFLVTSTAGGDTGHLQYLLVEEL